MEKLPTISVLMSTYNTPHEWLSEAIKSVLEQTFSDFEFIIVDDCSVESIDDVKDRFKDPRIVWMRNDKNLGLTKTLNKALRVARGKYIARMDSDDISMPERFAVQVEFMEKHPEVIVSGSYRRAFGNEEKDEIWNLPKTREEQQVQLFFFNCGVTHPTAMLRKSMLDQYGITYNEEYKKAQDYGLWVQCTRYAPMAMIPQVLLKYRKSDQQISSAGRENQLENDKKVKVDQLKALGILATEEEKNMHICFCNGEVFEPIGNLENWVEYLKNQNNEIKYFVPELFEKELRRRWYDYCKNIYKICKKREIKQAYKKARTLSFVIKDAEIFIKQIIVKGYRR